MVELVAKDAFDGLLPFSAGDTGIARADPGRLTSVAPFAGQGRALAAALQSAHGLGWPAPNRATGKAGARMIWFGRDMALLAGPEPDPGLGRWAALSDQSDAWAAVELSGPGGEAVLARLVPVDLRERTFKRGHTVRSQIGHMNASITRTGAQAFLILVFRSMAGTLVHELKAALEARAARG